MPGLAALVALVGPAAPGLVPVLAALVALAAPAPAALALAALQLVHQHQALHLTQHVITGPLGGPT